MVMNHFFSSDLHLNHKSVLTYTKRPWDAVEEMNEALIQNWNKVVKPSDKVYHLGDFCWGYKGEDATQFLARLNGFKIFIKGNHDWALEETAAIVHERLEIKINDIPIILDHYAGRTWNRSHYGSYQLHGHSHGNLPDDPNLLQMDVGVDCHPEYRPFSFEEVLAHMSKKTFVPIQKRKLDLEIPGRTLADDLPGSY